MPIRRREKHPGSKNRLELKNLWKGLSTEDLIWLIMYSEQEFVQKKAWEKLKANGELTLIDIYELTNGPEFIQEELLQMFLKEANPEDLSDAIDSVPSFFDEAKKKLFAMIKNGKLRKGRAKHILINIIKQIPSLRREAFKLLKKLNLYEAELKKLLDMKFMYSEPKMQQEIEELIRKVAKKNHGSKIVRKIKELEEQLQKPKKG